ncbi:MAG: cytidine deaminase [Bacteroidota bacterium]|nr:cytidine deaminase [Bacteroidota bacterium]
MLNQLREHAQQAADHAFTPFSGEPRAAAALLSDGRWVCGVRVESASFSLVIPALTAAFSICSSAGRRDIAAVALSGPARPYEKAFLAGTFAGSPVQHSSDVFTFGQLPSTMTSRLPLRACCPDAFSAEAGVALARKAATSAYTPLSGFPVGCVITAAGGLFYSGSNMEHTDWARTICAERSAIAAAVSDGAYELDALYLTCLKDPIGTPCGACRQLIAERLPDAEIWMDRGIRPPERTTPAALLPGAFTGRGL